MYVYVQMIIYIIIRMCCLVYSDDRIPAGTTAGREGLA